MILSKILKNTFLVLVFGLVVTACATKKTTTSAATSGTLYKIYGCGYMMPKGTTTEALDIAAFLDLDPDILIPLESTVIYQN